MARKYISKTGLSKSRFNRKRLALILLFTVLLVLALLEATNTTYLLHSKPTPKVIPVTRPASKPGNSSSSPSTSAGNNTEKSTNSTGSVSKLPLYAPYGNFVSNHHPGKNGAPTSETSVCNTTPGATCVIKFTKGGTTTSLPGQKVNSNGTTYWYWDVKKAGLTSGDWTITAIASLNGQTKSTKDPLNLTIN